VNKRLILLFRAAWVDVGEGGRGRVDRGPTHAQLALEGGDIVVGADNGRPGAISLARLRRKPLDRMR
jgi:hypothetical protein